MHVQLLLVKFCVGDCEWKEKKRTVKEGEIVRFLKKVKICEGGKLKHKKISETTYSIACNGKYLYQLHSYYIGGWWVSLLVNGWLMGTWEVG